MARYFYSLDNADMLTHSNQIKMGLANAAEGKYELPKLTIDSFSEKARAAIKDMTAELKKDIDVFIDPMSGNVTVDQMRFYAFKKHLSEKDKENFKSLVERFINGGRFVKGQPEEYKTFANKRIQGFDWDDPMQYKALAEDLLVEYEARCAYDPETFKPYGTLYRSDKYYALTRGGMQEGTVYSIPFNYFLNTPYQNEHMERVGERYTELRDKKAPRKIQDRNIKAIYGKEPFFLMFNDITEKLPYHADEHVDLTPNWKYMELFHPPGEVDLGTI